MSERNGFDQNDWQPRDAWMGLLFLGVGSAFVSILVSLIQSGQPADWLIIAIGGVGWLSGPLCLLIGGNALFQSIKSLNGKLRS